MTNLIESHDKLINLYTIQEYEYSYMRKLLYLNLKKIN